MHSLRTSSIFLSAFAIAFGAAACSAGLDSATGAFATNGGDGSNTVPGSDAGTGPTTQLSDDAGTAGANLYNALCRVGTPCVPDSTNPPVSNMCNLGPDAGAGVTDPDDAGTYDAGPSPIACHVTLDATSTDSEAICSAAGTGGNGAQCLGSSDCAAGFECVGSPGVCRRYCCTLPGKCDANSFCDVQAETSAGSVKVPVCQPVQPCQLLGGDAMCGTGETCGIVNDDDGTTSCLSAGPADVGEDCDDTHCKKDLVCLGDTGSKKCLALCDKTHPSCDSSKTCMGAAPLFAGVNAQIGVCE